MLTRRCLYCNKKLTELNEKYGFDPKCPCKICHKYWVCWDCGIATHENPLTPPEIMSDDDDFWF